MPWSDRSRRLARGAAGRGVIERFELPRDNPPLEIWNRFHSHKSRRKQSSPVGAPKLEGTTFSTAKGLTNSFGFCSLASSAVASLTLRGRGIGLGTPQVRVWTNHSASSKEGTTGEGNRRYCGPHLQESNEKILRTKNLFEKSSLGASANRRGRASEAKNNPTRPAEPTRPGDAEN